MEKESFIFGIRAIIEAIQSGKDLDKVYLQKGLQGSLMQELIQLVQSNGLSSSFVPVERLNRFTKKNHQGAVATLAPITFYPLEDLVIKVVESGKTPLFLLLDQVSDVRNFGALIRTAECTGVDGIIIPSTGAAPVSADTVKTSAGAVFNVPICKVDHLRDAIFYLQSSGIQIVAASEKTENLIYNIDLTPPLAILMGSEDTGIAPALLKSSDHIAKLPMYGSIGSLNVSVACGAFLYEVIRQRLG